MPATDTSRPVALLARPGQARERLRHALDAAGVDVVLEADPNGLDAATLTAAGAGAVLVALEPAVEDALEALEPVLESPGLLVIFDEAELAARRDGWEAQRWIRHLAAKLHGHDDVLPPGREQDLLIDLQPGHPPTPQQLHAGAPFDPHLAEAAERAGGLPEDRPGEAALAKGGHDLFEGELAKADDGKPGLARHRLRNLQLGRLRVRRRERHTRIRDSFRRRGGVLAVVRGRCRSAPAMEFWMHSALPSV